MGHLLCCKKSEKTGAWVRRGKEKAPPRTGRRGRKRHTKPGQRKKRLPACTPPLTGTPFAGTRQRGRIRRWGQRPGQTGSGRAMGRQAGLLALGQGPLQRRLRAGITPGFPILPAAAKPRQGTWRSFAEQKRFARNGLIIKPIKKRKASANAFSSVRQNPSLVNENRSA